MRALVWQAQASRALRGNMTAAAKNPSGARPDSFLPAIGTHSGRLSITKICSVLCTVRVTFTPKNALAAVPVTVPLSRAP